MNKRERDVLHSLCDGDITFSEAADRLGVTEEKIEEMLDGYNWLPSAERLAEFNETEIETLSYIRDIFQPIKFRISRTHEVLRYQQIECMGSTTVKISNISIPIVNIPPQIVGDVVLRHTEDNGIAYIQFNKVL